MNDKGLLVLRALIAILLAVSTTSPGWTAEPAHPVTARLVPEASAIAPGQTLWLDVHLDIAPGWHTYWRNPGDSGLPTEIAWRLPEGFAGGDIAWPAPERFVVGTIGNYGYEGSTDLLVPVRAATGVAPGATVHLAADASWLACAEICIPDEAHLALDLPVIGSPASPDARNAALFASARERLPKPADFAATATISEKAVTLTLPAQAVAGRPDPRPAFFPLADGLLDAAAEPQLNRQSDSVQLLLPRVAGPNAKAPATLAGVLTLGDARHAYSIEAPLVPATAAAEDAAAPGWWRALLLAFAGGLVLNLMPCVFPVLSLKLLGLTGAVHRSEERRHGFAYAAGVIASFALLGSVLLGLRAGGAAIGWGFQLQSPILVGALAYLLFAMGLCLSGVVELGAGLGGLGGRFTERAGVAGAFATGVLATVVATPCTAPFMGAALGFALVAPASLALAIFIALGAGLAAPVTLAAMIPGIARLLPRPGPWMSWFKQLLAFPLYGTAAWLVWVLAQEVDPGSLFFALIGLVAIGFAAWIYGRTQFGGAAARRIGIGSAAAGIAAAVLLMQLLAPANGNGTPRPAQTGLAYEKFSPDRITRLTAEHRPVFVNLTAAWCITCLVNERTTLDSAPVRQAFAEHRIVALKGDWTRRDPDIAAFLERFGRSGVPLYLLYDRSGTPTVLPQILTEAAMIAAVGRI